MKYGMWLDEWFRNYIQPSSKIKTCERYSEIIEKHLKVKLGEYELDELTPLVLQRYVIPSKSTGIKLKDGLSVMNLSPSNFKNGYSAAETLNDFWDFSLFPDSSDIMTILDHVKSNFNGTTLRDFFSMIGYDVSGISQGAYFMVNQDMDVRNFTYIHYSGISIDDPNYNVVNGIVVYEGDGSGDNSTIVTIQSSH